MSTDTTKNPMLIGIDDDVRPMTPEETNAWLATEKGASAEIDKDAPPISGMQS